MFASPDGSPIINKSRYDVPDVVQFDDTDADLFTVPHPSYLAYDYPKIITRILEIHGPSMLHSNIKSKLVELGVPTDTGYTTRGILELQRFGLVIVTRSTTNMTVRLNKNEVNNSRV